MDRLSTSFLCLILFLCVSCAGSDISQPPIYVTGTFKTSLLPLANIESRTIKQQITANYSSSEYVFTSVLKISPDEIAIVVVGDFGRLLSATYNGSSIQSNVSSFVPAGNKIAPEYIFSDIQLVYYPISIITKYMNSSISVTESVHNSIRTRTFTYNGFNFAQVKYYPNGLLEFKNFERKYSYIIKELIL